MSKHKKQEPIVIHQFKGAPAQGARPDLVLEEGITVINDTDSDVSIMVVNQYQFVIGGVGTAKPGSQLVIPTSWAYYDVYVQFRSGPADLFIVVPTVYASRKKTMVGYRDTLKVSDMPPA